MVKLAVLIREKTLFYFNAVWNPLLDFLCEIEEKNEIMIYEFDD